MLIAIAVLIAIARLAPGSNKPQSVETPAPEVAPAAPEPLQTLETTQRFFTARPAPLYRKATAGSVVATLARGVVVIGLVVPGANGAERWLQLKEGSNTGLYLLAANLSDTEPPALDYADAGLHMLATEATLLAEPRADASPLAGDAARLASGDRVDVDGTIGGQWLEIALPQGGVAYLPRTAILAPEAAPRESDPVAAKADSDAENGSEQRARDVTINYFAASGGSNDRAIAFMSEAYAPTIDFYGRPRAREDVLRDKQQYNERWPIRRYELQPGSPSVACQEDGTCEAQGVITFYASSTERGASSSGTASFSLTISSEGLILAESGKVLTRF